VIIIGFFVKTFCGWGDRLSFFDSLDRFDFVVAAHIGIGNRYRVSVSVSVDCGRWQRIAKVAAVVVQSGSVVFSVWLVGWFGVCVCFIGGEGVCVCV